MLVLPTALPGPGYRGVVSVHLWVGAGAAAERVEEHGCAHLLEHMAFKPFVDGQGRTRDLASVVERLGGDINAFTSHDETVFHATAPADAVAEVIDVILAATLERELVGEHEAEQLAREREVVIEEIRQYRDDPSSRSLQSLMADLHGDHPYGRPVLGSEDEVAALTPAILRGWHRRQYRGARVLVVVAGPIDVAPVLEQASARLSRLPAGERSTRRAEPNPPREPRIRVERADVQEAYLRLGWLGGTVLDARGVALDVAAVALGQGESSRLAVGIRRRARLVSDAHASYFGGVAGGAFLISAQSEPRLAEQAIVALLAEVDTLARVPLDVDELARARALLRSSLVYRRETVQGQAHALGYYATASGRLGAEDDYFRELEALDPERVQAICAEHLRRDRLALTLILPRDRVDARAARALATRLRGRCSNDSPEPLARTSGEVRPSKRTTNRRKRAERDEFGTWHAKLGSGMRVVARPDASVPVVGGWLVWPGGLRFESAREGGIASLTGMLLNRGSSRRSGDALAREIEGLAAVIDGFAGHDSLGLQFECLSADLSTILARTLECASDPIFAEAELDEARRVTIADLEAELDDPGHVAYRTMLATLYGKHPHGRDLRGTPETLRALDRGKIERHYHGHYALGRSVLALAGDVEIDALLDQLEDLSRAWIAREPPESSPTLPGGPPTWPKRARVHTLEREREQGQVVIGFPGLALRDRRGAALDVLCTVLGGQAGRLFERLREREGLVYQVGASSGEHVEGGHVVVYAAASQDKLDAARRAIELEIARIASEPITAHELQGAQRWLLGQFESGMQRRGRIASRLVFGEAYALGANHYLRYPERVAGVKAKQVLELARELFDPRRRVTCLVRARG